MIYDDDDCDDDGDDDDDDDHEDDDDDDVDDDDDEPKGPWAQRVSRAPRVDSPDPLEMEGATTGRTHPDPPHAAGQECSILHCDDDDDDDDDDGDDDDADDDDD